MCMYVRAYVRAYVRVISSCTAPSLQLARLYLVLVPPLGVVLFVQVVVEVEFLAELLEQVDAESRATHLPRRVGGPATREGVVVHINTQR